MRDFTKGMRSTYDQYKRAHVQVLHPVQLLPSLMSAQYEIRPAQAFPRGAIFSARLFMFERGGMKPDGGAHLRLRCAKVWDGHACWCGSFVWVT
jgi:hypothetical protein